MIKYGNVVIRKSGSFNQTPNTATEAELMCIGNAIHTLTKIEDVPTVDIVVINTDCLPAIHMLIKKKNNIAIQISSNIDQVKTKIGSNKTKIDFRHVKAHNGKDDARSFVNDWCDKQAKFHMRKKVKDEAKG